MRRNDSTRQGSSIAEFALILSILLVPLFAGVWDVSKFIDINQILTRAAREGVVTASRGDDPTEQVMQYVEAAGLTPASLTVTVEYGPEEPGLGQEVGVRLNYDFSGYTVLPWEDIITHGISSAAYAKME